MLREELDRRIRTWFTTPGAPGSPVYLVGGAVRDFLLGGTAKDLDLVAADAGALAARLAERSGAKVVPWKRDFPKSETYRLVKRMADGSLEVLDLSAFQGGSLEADLAARDFTVNAMALPLSGGLATADLIDPFGGKDDLLTRRLVRVVSPGCLAADPLRILRAYRFSATLGLGIDPETRAAVLDVQQRLAEPAGERIAQELLRILSVPRSAPVVRLMSEDGVLGVLFPEILPMLGCTQNAFHAQDVWEHSLTVFENCEEVLDRLEAWLPGHAAAVRDYLGRGDRAAWLKLGALLHDVGKPATRGVSPETGRITFYGHDRQGARMVREIAARLRLSGEVAAFLEAVVDEHLHVQVLCSPEAGRPARLRWHRKYRDETIGMILLGTADIKGTIGPALGEERRRVHLASFSRALADYLDRIRPELERKPLVTGKDLLAMGMAPGPRVGRLLQDVVAAQDEGRLRTREEALAYVRGLVEREGLRGGEAGPATRHPDKGGSN